MAFSEACFHVSQHQCASCRPAACKTSSNKAEMYGSWVDKGQRHASNLGTTYVSLAQTGEPKQDLVLEQGEDVRRKRCQRFLEECPADSFMRSILPDWPAGEGCANPWILQEAHSNSVRSRQLPQQRENHPNVVHLSAWQSSSVLGLNGVI